MNGAADVPVLQDEINRKAFTAMEWLTCSLSKGTMNSRQFSTGVDALFMAVAGLVDKSIMELMTAAIELADGSAPFEKRHFVKDGTVISLLWQVGEGSVQIFMRESGVRGSDRLVECDGAIEAQSKMTFLGERLIKIGYTEL